MVVTPESYIDYVDRDPNPFLRLVRDRGRVAWDEALQSWLVTEYEDVSHILRNEEQFRPPFVKFGFNDFFGPRGLLLLQGEPHRQLYISVRKFFSPKVVAAYRERLVLPIIEDRLARILPTSRAELAHDFAEQIPVRVIAGILGLDWRDDGLIQNCWDWVDAYQRHTLNYILPGDAPERTRTAAAEGMRKLDEVLLPLVEASTDQAADTYIREVHRTGNKIFPDWTVADTVDQCRFLFVAGMHTTTSLICNAAHLLLADSALRASVAADLDSRLGPFIEETLRLRPSIQLRPRMAAKDLEWHGAKIKAGDQVLAILAAGNRSPDRYERPDDVNLCRDGLSSHLSFNVGPRFCGGAPLARAEATESLRAILTRMPGLHLDTSRPGPDYVGFIQRTMRPLHVRFEAVHDAASQPRKGGVS